MTPGPKAPINYPKAKPRDLFILHSIASIVSMDSIDSQNYFPPTKPCIHATFELMWKIMNK
jgi:hypothetical protein